MEKPFKHPLARNATTATLRRRDGAEETLLVIVTTLELDPAAKGFNKKNVDRLRHAAEAYLSEASGIAAYTVVNRPKEWDA